MANNESKEKIAFFCRAKPQDYDALEIFKTANMVFIGYPLLKQGHTYDPQALRTCLVDPTCGDNEWASALKEKKADKGFNARAFNKNRNFIKNQVTIGSIVVIPRPEQGKAYLGRITEPFQIVNSPSWAKDYLELRNASADEDREYSYIADVAQGWKVDEYRDIDLSEIPGWIRHSMFGRSTYGKIRKHHPLDEELDEKETSFDVLQRICAGQSVVDYQLTSELTKIKRRLIDTLTANAFESLVVSLLQLEYPDEIWQHTGGPGDGGIDGLGFNEKGKVVGLMQAKLFASSAPELGSLGHDNHQIRRYAAVLVPENPSHPSHGTELLNLDWIAEKVLKHANRLPQAIALRVAAK